MSNRTICIVQTIVRGYQHHVASTGLEGIPTVERSHLHEQEDMNDKNEMMKRPNPQTNPKSRKRHHPSAKPKPKYLGEDSSDKVYLL